MKYKTIKDSLEHIEAYANGKKIIAIHLEDDKYKIYKALVEFEENEVRND